MSTGKLDAHWKDLQKKIECEHASLARKWKLRSRWGTSFVSLDGSSSDAPSSFESILFSDK